MAKSRKQCPDFVEEEITRDPFGRFVKGTKGPNPHPTGPKKHDKEFLQLMRAHTVEALKVIIEIMQSPDAETKYKLGAAQYIVDRFYGKAAQPIHNVISTGSDEPIQIIFKMPEPASGGE